MIIEIIVVSSFQQNCRILYCEDTKEGILVDPGDESEKILDKINRLGIKIKYILGTHGHLDHIGAVKEIQTALQVPFCIHREDEFLLQHIQDQVEFFGWHSVEQPKIDKYLQEGDTLSFGKYTGMILHTPGHSQGSISFLVGKDILVGDLLFAGSIGRTDLPGGSFQSLLHSLQEKISALPENTIVHPGHGPSTTVGYEKENNPFFHY